MTGEYFKDVVKRVCETKHLNKTQVSRYLKIHKVTLNLYEKNGVPKYKAPLVMKRLNDLLFDIPCDI